MAQQYDIQMPQDLDLVANWTIRVTAVDPTTGNAVSGMSVSDLCILGDSANPEGLAYGPFMLVPGPGA